ncbi:YmjA family protein [Escherichia coli]|uniref:YmjA family protein n=1 Tax=Escherichia coli TaxID=562 RepID=UPI00045653B9|nr:YmjA family protein [Escherichia coli]AHM52586.1 hypothetical protein CF60_12825 [Escherichia coli]
MNHDIPLKYFDIADEYAPECAEPVADAERTPLAHYFQLLLTRLMNNEEISEEAQHEMAAEAGINPVRIDEIVCTGANLHHGGVYLPGGSGTA